MRAQKSGPGPAQRFLVRSAMSGPAILPAGMIVNGRRSSASFGVGAFSLRQAPDLFVEPLPDSLSPQHRPATKCGVDYANHAKTANSSSCPMVRYTGETVVSSSTTRTPIPAFLALHCEEAALAPNLLLAEARASLWIPDTGQHQTLSPAWIPC